MRGVGKLKVVSGGMTRRSNALQGGGDRRANLPGIAAARGEYWPAVLRQNLDQSVAVQVGQQSHIVRGTDLVGERVETSAFNFHRPKASAEHPTMKPAALIERMLKNSTRQGDVVLDLFVGSVSVLIASEQLGRFARLVELDGRFVDVIVRRWRDQTGRAAVLEGDGRSFEALVKQHHERGGR